MCGGVSSVVQRTMRGSLVAGVVVALLLCCSACQAATDLYAELGVSRTATLKEIKKAYRKKSVAVHPDKHPAEEKEQWEAAFVKLVNAYDILSDEDKRRAYDNGEDDMQMSFSCVWCCVCVYVYVCVCVFVLRCLC